jgi:hypothetical protein
MSSHCDWLRLPFLPPAVPEIFLSMTLPFAPLGVRVEPPEVDRAV